MRFFKPVVFLLLISVISGCVVLSERRKAVLAQSVNNLNFFIDLESRNKVRRVLLLPVYDQQNLDQNILNQLNETIKRRLSYLSLFEIINSSFDNEETRDLYSELFSGKSDQLKKMAAEFGVDNVLYTTITSLSAYSPRIISVKIKLVSTVDGSVLWSVDDSIDYSNKDHQRLYNYWVDENIAERDEFKQNQYENSFQNFISFAFSMFFQTFKADQLAEQYPANV